MSLTVHQFACLSDNYGFLVRDDATGKTATIDTPDADAILGELGRLGWSLDLILNTHWHPDHAGGNAAIKAATGATIVGPAEVTRIAPLDREVRDGDVVELGETRFTVIDTGGHTLGHIAYHDARDQIAFVGDTLFMPDYGTARADFPGGDAATLYRSIRKILALPPETRIFVGHDYLPADRQTHVWESTVAREWAGNIHVQDGVEEAAFVTMRQARDATLDAPTLILPALQVNIRAGALPAASPSGRVFLKLPVNAL